MSKDFLTYNQQMRYLRDNKKISCCGTLDKNILVSNGYFNLVNGYKTPFSVGKDIDGHHIYAPHTSLNEMYSLKLFDDELRLLFFKYITKIETEIRSLSAYSFDHLNKNNSLTWYNVTAFDTAKNMTDIISLISKIYSELSRSKHSYVKNHLNNYNSIPTWIMIKVISFSNTIDFIDLTPITIKNNLCELFSMKNMDGTCNHQLLVGSLQWLRKIRNSCAHNERVYDITLTNQRITDTYFELMARSYNRGRDKKIIDAIIYFKYFLPHDQFERFIRNLDEMLLDLQTKLQPQSFARVRAAMGIKDINHLDLLLQQSKNIRYNSHS